MNRVARWASNLYPAGFLAAYVLLSFTATPTPMSGLWRPLLVAVAGSVALQVALTAATRSWARSALITSALVMVLAAAWLILAVAAVLAGWWVVINFLRRRAGRKGILLSEKRASDTLRVFSVAFALVAAVPAVGWALATANLGPEVTTPSAAATSTPDIVVLMLDGYPRADSLQEQFAFDNRPFQDALEARGLRVATDSRSNYTATWATMASMMDMRFVEEIDSLNPAPVDPAEQYRRLIVAINEGRALSELKGRGYEIITVPSPFESSALVSADRYLDGGHLTSFELSLVQHSVIGSVALAWAPHLFFDAHRARITDGFETIAEVMQQPSDQARFVFAHLLTPHAPTVFDASGRPAQPMACFPECSPWSFSELGQWGAFPAQVTHVNSLVLETIDAVVSAAPDAVVVVMSDHGSQVPGQDSANQFRTLFAARTPGSSVGITDASPVNLFPQLFNAYFSTDIELHPYRAWESEFAAPLTLTPMNVDSRR